MSSAPDGFSRREIAALAAGAGLAALAGAERASADEKGSPMKTVCFIRYQIDPFQKEAFRAYAAAWGPIIPRLGGHLIGYFLPDEGNNDIAFALIGFDSLAAYEAYRKRLKADPEARANLSTAVEKRFILREERTFLESVDGTFERPAAPA